MSSYAVSDNQTKGKRSLTPNVLFLTCLSSWLIAAPMAMAQVTPDGSLSTTVDASGNNFTIENGERVGNNLFHSFREFSIPTNGKAFFNNSVDIQNIFSRVTGGNISKIDGLILANGGANLFLLNPAGIVFGPNARLDIGGSFFGSTAESILFQDGRMFSATGEAGSSPLLTVSVPIGLQLGSRSGAIRVEGAGNTTVFPESNSGLSVRPGNTLALVGSGIALSGGILTAESGRIELGSVSNGKVSLTPLEVGWQLEYSPNSEFNAIALQARSSLWNPNTRSNPQGGIHVRGSQILLERSQIATRNTKAAIGAPVSLNATESLQLLGTFETVFPLSAWIVSQVAPEATGFGGDVSVNAPQLTLQDGARIQTLTEGAGTAGDVSIQASEISIRGFATPPKDSPLARQPLNSRISSETSASGNSGSVRVSTHNATLASGGQIGTISGKPATGDGGSVSVVATGTIAATGINPTAPNTLSGIVSTTLGSGRGGDIQVQTGQLRLAEGAVVQTLSQGSGRGGDIAVSAIESIVGTGIHPTQRFLSTGIISFTSGSGDGGNIQVETEQLTMLDGADVSSFVRVLGDYFPGAATGRGGNVSVNARSIDLIGVSPASPTNASSVGSRTFGAGAGGRVQVSTERLTIADGAVLASLVLTSTSAAGQPLPEAGTGEGGDVFVNASESIEVRGFNAYLLSNSSLLGSLSFGSGKAGDATATTSELIVRNSGEVSTATSATGDSGQLTVNANSIEIGGSGPVPDSPAQISAGAFIEVESVQRSFFLPPFPTGNTAEVKITADRIAVSDGGIISVRHQGSGNAGQLQVNADTIVLERSGQITASTRSGVGGNILLQVRDLQLRSGSQVAAEAGGLGNGGNITIDSEAIALLENSRINANAFQGAGGNIQISTQGLFSGLDSRITASSQFGISGTVNVSVLNLNQHNVVGPPPSNFVSPDQVAANSCTARQGNSQGILTIAGNGGLPETPETGIIPYQLVQVQSGQTQPTPSSFQPSPDAVSQDTSSWKWGDPIVEATEFSVNAQGQVVLTAKGNSAGSSAHPQPILCQPN